jgi:hypothetical protein
MNVVFSFRLCVLCDLSVLWNCGYPANYNE